MKKIIALLALVIITMSFSACIGDKPNPNIEKFGLDSNKIQRIVITNSRYAGRYTIIDKNTIKSFINTILISKDAAIDSKLDEDFVFEFYDDTHNVATFKYIASLDNKDTANLIDQNGKLYKVSTSIEDSFMRRLMNKDDYKNVQDYYRSLIKLIVDKIRVKNRNVVAVDISNDYVVSRSITSIEEKNILGSIDMKGGSIVFPNATSHYDYIIKISTDKYNDESSDATITVTDSKKSVVKYEMFGVYESGGWNYHITYK